MCMFDKSLTGHLRAHKEGDLGNKSLKWFIAFT